MLRYVHNIFPHLIHPLIQFASYSQLDKKTNSSQQYDQQQQESSSSLSLITSYLKLLSIIISNNYICQELINKPKALHSLTTLSSYKLYIHFKQEYDQQSLSVRSSSRECLGRIQIFGDLSAYSELVNANYTGVFVIAISTAGSNSVEQDREIWIGLSCISNLLNDLHQGKNYGTSFPPQPLLA
ncbi:MAG: hypothetical protein EZS28_040374 [Streblomastix strix]|uniref:Uncharacterized protein n=1 Tax=Streblomastix strix TaxID=222440 RepID=A0A5J4U1D9_9EUKA|nr:MAG: hypothetical protein EZS28_040374 [Streblomastix strix]